MPRKFFAATERPRRVSVVPDLNSIPPSFLLLGYSFFPSSIWTPEKRYILLASSYSSSAHHSADADKAVSHSFSSEGSTYRTTCVRFGGNILGESVSISLCHFMWGDGRGRFSTVISASSPKVSPDDEGRGRRAVSAAAW